MTLGIGDFTLNIIASDGQWFFITLSFFCGLGFLNGWLFRNIRVLKIIALFFVLPYSLDLLIALNRMWEATVPFLVSAWFGWYGLQKTWYKLEEIVRALR